MTRTGGSGRLPRSHAPRRLLPVATVAVAFLPLDGHAAIGTQTPGGTLDLDDLERLAVISEVALSPDGRTVLFRRLDPVSEGVGWRGSLWGVAADGGEPVPLLENASGARWAPDGDRFAFLRATESGSQVWLAGSSGRESRPLTAHPGGVLDYAWAPDGTAIAFVAVAGEDAGDRAGSAQLFVQGVEDDAARRLTACHSPGRK